MGNNKVLLDTIQNFTTLQWRRVDTTAKVANGVDVNQAIELLRPRSARSPTCRPSSRRTSRFSSSRPRARCIAVRPYTHTDHYWQVYFDTHRAIVKTFGAAGYPTPETPIAHRPSRRPRQPPPTKKPA